MKNKKPAFTLGEVLMTLAIIGVIAALLIPMIKQIQPDKQKVLFKKAYTNVERVVTELVNDEYLYPEADGKQGLDNTTSVTVNDRSYGGANKFCELFAMKLNTLENDVNCGGTNVSFITNDSIAYYMPSSTFATEATITIDTNGDKAPNCKFNTGTCKTPDRFEILVAPDGGIRVTGDLEKDYLRSTSVTKEAGHRGNN